MYAVTGKVDAFKFKINLLEKLFMKKCQWETVSPDLEENMKNLILAYLMLPQENLDEYFLASDSESLKRNTYVDNESFCIRTCETLRTG